MRQLLSRFVNAYSQLPYLAHLTATRPTPVCGFLSFASGKHSPSPLGLGVVNNGDRVAGSPWFTEQAVGFLTPTRVFAVKHFVNK